MTILMHAQKLTDASLIYRTGPQTKTSKMKKLKNKRICSEETVPGKTPWSQSGKRPQRVTGWLWRWFDGHYGVSLSLRGKGQMSNLLGPSIALADWQVRAMKQGRP